MRKPSDLGFNDDLFHLPPLVVREHIVTPEEVAPGRLFDVPASGLREEREDTRRSITERCEMAAEAISDAAVGVSWCQLNDESHLLTKLIDGAVELAGSDSAEDKESKLLAFGRGDIRVLVTKPSIGAWGLNWQHAHRMTYFPSHSYEQWYQAVRRMWRFGQVFPVEVDVISTPGGHEVLANLQRKAEQADAMFAALVDNMNEAAGITGPSYDNAMEAPLWIS